MTKVMSGKTCVVTGAARGIGKAVAMKYAENGANVVLIDLNKEALEDATQQIEALGINVLSLAVNLSSVAEIKYAMDVIEEKYGTIDVLANCAGIAVSKRLQDVSEEEWDAVFNVNLKSIFLLSNRASQNMIRNGVKNGKIVSISSQASKLGEVGNGPYCASKAGLNSLTQVLALELGEHGISVNAICPGFVDTEMLREVLQKRSLVEGKTPAEYEKLLMDQVPMKRLSAPEEIADLAYFLSSENANYITGVSITIAGGKTII